MDEGQALAAFSALGQAHRLRILRALVAAGPEGLPAGMLAAALGVSLTNLSFHLKELTHAELIQSRREGRSIIYSAAYPVLSRLIAFLMKDCCQGRPEVCAPALAALTSPCPPSEMKPMPDRPYDVLFLCTGNAVRSIMAEAMLNQDGQGRFRAFSGGVESRGPVHPLTLQVLTESGYSLDGLRSKSWDEFIAPDAPEMDFVITLCDEAAGESCPVWPGAPVTAHWGIENPAAVEGSPIARKTAFVTAQRYLRNRIAALVALPLASLDGMALHSHLHEIGRQDGATAPQPPIA